jgi:hypothetical protein
LHGDWFVGMFFVLPSVMFDDSFDVFFTTQFNGVPSLLDIHSVESFDDAQVMQFVLHMFLDFLSHQVSNFLCLCAYEKVIDLLKDEYETMSWVVLEVETRFMCGVVELQFVDENVIDVFAII